MSGPHKNLPRFLPTLTEVVQVSEGTQPSSGAMGDDELIERVVQRLLPLLAQELHERLDAWQQGQRAALETQLLQDLTETLRQSVVQALAAERAAFAQR